MAKRGAAGTRQKEHSCAASAHQARIEDRGSQGLASVSVQGSAICPVALKYVKALLSTPSTCNSNTTTHVHKLVLQHELGNRPT